MMHTQQSSTFLGAVSAEAVRELPAGHVVALGTGGGQVSILSGSVWLTSSGDPDDHFLGAGESFAVRDAGQVLVETSSRGTAAVIAWQPRTLLERVRDRFVRSSARCWDLVNPAGRIGIGSVAAVAALAVAGALFGAASESRVRHLGTAAGSGTVLHNAKQGAAVAAKRTVADDSNTGVGTPGAARQADRRAPGTA